MGKLRDKRLNRLKKEEAAIAPKPVKTEEIKETSWFDIDSRDKKVESKPKKKKAE